MKKAKEICSSRENTGIPGPEGESRQGGRGRKRRAEGVQRNGIVAGEEGSIEFDRIGAARKSRSENEGHPSEARRTGSCRGRRIFQCNGRSWKRKNCASRAVAAQKGKAEKRKKVDIKRSYRKRKRNEGERCIKAIGTAEGKSPLIKSRFRRIPEGPEKGLLS